MKSRPLKVCLATPEYPPFTWGGLARTVERVAGHLSELGLEVHVAHFIIEDHSDILLDENRDSQGCGRIMVHRLRLGRETMKESGREIWDCPHTLTLRMMYQSLELLHLDEDFDLFHGFFLYPVGYVTGLLAARFHRPAIIVLAGNDIKKYIFSPEKAALCQSGLENASRVVCLSRELLELADALTPIRAKARIIYNSVRIPPRAWSVRPADGHPPSLGSAGIFKYAKGLPYLFKAAADLADRWDIRVELRGVVRESEIKSFNYWLDQSGVRDLVRLGPPVAHGEIFDWLGSLDIFVLPSISEGCPNILLEAMAAGLPCVATRVGAVPDLIVDQECGLLVPWGDARALSGAIETILKRPDRGARLGRAARKRMEDFSSRRERADWETLYKELGL